MNAKYFALLEDNQTVISKSSLKLINTISAPIKYIIKQEFDSQFEDLYNNKIDLFAYTSVDLNGNHKPLEIQNFIFIDLGTDTPGRNVNERKISVKEKNTGIIRKFPSNSANEYFLKFDLVKLIKKLNTLGNFEVLDKFEELEKSNERVKILEGIIERLNNEIKALKELKIASNSTN